MSVFANVLVKNDEQLLTSVLPIWREYDVDKWVFHDAGSSDKTRDVITDVLGRKAEILEDTKRQSLQHRHQEMLTHSREGGSDFVLVLTPEELLARSLLDNFSAVLDMHTRYNIFCYWYHVSGDMKHIRQDPPLIEDYRSVLYNTKHAENFDISDNSCNHHRVPKVELPPVVTRDIGVISLECLDKEYYALKHLYLKHVEYKELKNAISDINYRYDERVNGLQFEETQISEKITDGIDFDSSVFNTVASEKKFKEYILKNRVDELITFGEEYLS